MRMNLEDHEVVFVRVNLARLRLRLTRLDLDSSHLDLGSGRFRST